MSTRLMVHSILELSHEFSEERELRYRRIKKPTDLKIKTLVFQQIIQSIEGKVGALFPSAMAPKVVIGLLSALNYPKKTKEGRIKLVPSQPRLSRPPFRTAPFKRVPIGLNRCEPYHWINSLIQFLLFLPGSWELCSLIPRSFQPLREFADQYFFDQEANHSVSSADSAELVRCLMRKLPSYFQQRRPDLYAILSGWMRIMFPHCPFAKSGEVHPVVLHPEWHVVSDDSDFEETFQRKFSESPSEILVGFKDVSFPLKGHYFASSERFSSYELDAFIELRPDGDNGENYITYLKNSGTWYQCDDDRIIQFRSNCLNTPLQRAILLHYKRVELVGPSKIFIKR